MIRAVYPGTFDPVTNGHLDVIERAAKIFDELIVAVTTNPAKTPWFTLEERVEMLKECCSHLPNVTVEAFDGLLVNFVRQKGAKVIIKGLRAVTDFDYEFQMAAINRKLAPEIETLFLMTSLPYAYLSSSAVKEVASLNGCLKDLVPDNVAERLRKKSGGKEAVTISDIYRAITELEELVRNGRHILGRWVIVDEELFATKLHRMRASLPDEIRKAMEIQRESERYLRAAREEAQRIVEEAKREAERILEQARREAERLVEESLIVQQAEQRAREILQEAQQDAETRRRETDEYVRSVLKPLRTVRPPSP